MSMINRVASLIITVLFVGSTSIQARECPGILSRLLGIKPLFTCEQRAAMIQGGLAVMQPPPAPMILQPIPDTRPRTVIITRPGQQPDVWIVQPW